MDFISALVKRPGEPPRHVNVSNSLEALQTNEGGDIETVTLASDQVNICNEEGLLLDLPYNCTICGVDFVGLILMVGVKGDEFADLPVAWPELKKLFPQLWKEVRK